MNDIEKTRLVDSLAHAAKLLELAQAHLQRARSQCEGAAAYERVDLIAKRAFELKVKADWLRYSVLGKIHVDAANDRVGSDRRVRVDRRIVGMQKLLLSVA
jgi:hypothetical protein